jgi:hypothetical protein
VTSDVKAGELPATTREGWGAFVGKQPSTLELLTDHAWQVLAEDARSVYDQARFDHHAELVIVATPTIRQVAHTARRLVLLNHQQTGARRGMIVTGNSGTGKSTAVMHMGRAHEIRARRRAAAPDLFCPVVYVSVPPAATPKMLAAEFARFVGLPIPAAFNQASITNAVCDVLCRLRVEIVIIDELQNMNLATRDGAETSDQLKYLSERIPATFVCAGFDLEERGLFSGSRGRQIAGRFATIEATVFGYATTGQRRDWHALIATLDAAIRLHRHEPGMLVKHAAYLHQRTGGMIGSLSHLIRESAIDAILDGAEKITKSGMDRVTLDRAAEQALAELRRTRRRVTS